MSFHPTDGLGTSRSIQEAEVLQGSDSDSDDEAPIYGGRSEDEGVCFVMLQCCTMDTSNL